MAGTRLFLLLFSLLIFTSSSIAQSAPVRGRVEDGAFAPIAGAVVVLRNKATGAERTATTDGEGRFSFPGGTAGQFEIIVSSNGFARLAKQLEQAEGEIVLTLNPGPIQEDVTITATRTQVSSADTAVPVSVVGREEIERKAVNTIGDIFRTLPGTSTSGEGPFSVRPRIRGLDSNRVLILIDGERLNNSRTSTGQSGIETGLVETSQIETVEVARGSGSVLYGTDALAGTINIITRDTPPRRDGGLRFGAALDTFYSSNENGRRGNLAVTGSNRWFAFRAAQSLERFDNYFTGKAGGEVPADVLAIGGINEDGEVLNSQSHGGNTQLTGRFFIGDESTLRFNYERRRAANIGSAALVGVFNGFFPFSDRDKFAGRFDTVNITDNLQRVSVSGYYQKQLRNFTNILTVGPVPPFFPGQYQFSETVTDTSTAGFDVQTDWKLGSRNQLVAGASFFRDENSDQRLLITSTTSFSPNRTIRNSRSIPDASLSNFAVFAQDEFRVTNRLKLIGGVRFDRFTTSAQPTAEFTLDPRFTAAQIEDLGLAGITDGLQVTNTAVNGDFGAVYRITDAVSASARIGRSFRTPNLFERFFTDPGSVDGFLVGNKSLVPETGLNFDTSVKFSSPRVQGAVTYFNNHYENFLATPIATGRDGMPITLPRAGRPPLAVYQTQNVRKARIQGFEAELEVPFKISLGYLTPYGNFSYLRGDNLTEGVPLDSISPFRTNAGFRWQNFLKNYYVDYNARIVGKQERLSPTFLLPVQQGGNGGPEPGFVTHNLGGGYYLRRERFNFGINLGVSNIFGRSYTEQFTYAPARGRSFTIGTTWAIK
jgi:outer membrane receptor protein involved in Fe transport